jgi:hypothetical protein
MPKQYTCAVCKETFDQGWSEEEAEAELASTFGVPKDECDIVCDDCYRKMGFGDAE